MRNILVIYVSRIGDTMLITPAVRALARAWPQARIDFLGSAASSVVFENLPFVRSWNESDELMWGMIVTCIAVPAAMLAWFKGKDWI